MNPCLGVAAFLLQNERWPHCSGGFLGTSRFSVWFSSLFSTTDPLTILLKRHESQGHSANTEKLWWFLGLTLLPAEKKDTSVQNLPPQTQTFL